MINNLEFGNLKGVWTRVVFCGAILAIILGNITTFAQNDLNPKNPNPPVIPTFDGAETYNENSQSSSQNTSQSLQFSISSSFSSVSSSLASVSASSVSSSSNISSNSDFSSNFSDNSSQNSITLPPQIEQETTVRTGGFSTFLTMILFLAVAFGYRYHTFVKQNRGLKTTEKKINSSKLK